MKYFLFENGNNRKFKRAPKNTDFISSVLQFIYAADNVVEDIYQAINLHDNKFKDHQAIFDAFTSTFTSIRDFIPSSKSCIRLSLLRKTLAEQLPDVFPEEEQSDPAIFLKHLFTYMFDNLLLTNKSEIITNSTSLCGEQKMSDYFECEYIISELSDQTMEECKIDNTKIFELPAYSIITILEDVQRHYNVHREARGKLFELWNWNMWENLKISKFIDKDILLYGSTKKNLEPGFSCYKMPEYLNFRLDYDINGDITGPVLEEFLRLIPEKFALKNLFKMVDEEIDSNSFIRYDEYRYKRKNSNYGWVKRISLTKSKL